MALILLQPGTTTIFGTNKNTWPPEPGWLNQLNEQDRLTLGKQPCFELLSLQHGMQQQLSNDVSNSARTSGRPVITPFTCVKKLDASSVKLYDYFLRAEPLGKSIEEPTRIFMYNNQGGKMVKTMTFFLRDALITEIELQTLSDDLPTEQFKLDFTEIIWEYTVPAASESANTISSGWSVARNRPIGGSFSK
ncbi:MAG: type VI secretion system tube protein Hcp [Saprospiraceae bacterium]